MDILLHCCCAPCSLAVSEDLLAKGHSLKAYFFNPNIHPYQEFKARMEAFSAWVEGQPFPAQIAAEYPLEMWLRQVALEPEARCGFCYQSRLIATARLAQAQGYKAFSTTLLISPYQDHQAIIAAGELAAAQTGINFYYHDFRPLFRQGQAKARELDLYIQKYCGCIYSEKDRHFKGR
ncbi:MAG: epoxyqueuosine reductase QueH [Clostridiales bacterium]|nr:epoxyqueuosine reductase QueH [Clostridiales bacterium]